MSLANGRWRSPAETCEKDAATLTQFYVANKALTIGCRPITNRYLKLRFTGGGICEVKLLDAAGNTVTATTVTRACGASDPTKAMAMSAKIIDGDEGTCSARQPGWGCSAGGPNFVVLDMGDNFAQVASVEIAATSTTTRFWLFVSAASNPLGDPSKTWVDVGTAYSDSNNRKVLVQFPRALVLRSAEAGKSVREDLMCEMALCAAGQGQHRELVDPAADAPPCDDAAHACTIFDRDGTLPIPCRIYTSGHVTCAPANQDGECGIGLKLELCVPPLTERGTLGGVASALLRHWHRRREALVSDSAHGGPPRRLHLCSLQPVPGGHLRQYRTGGSLAYRLRSRACHGAGPGVRVELLRC